MIRLPIPQTTAEPTVESLKQRLDELETFIVEWMNAMSMQLNDAIAIGIDSNATAKRILDRLQATEIPDAPLTTKQVM